MGLGYYFDAVGQGKVPLATELCLDCLIAKADSNGAESPLLDWAIFEYDTQHRRRRARQQFSRGGVRRRAKKRPIVDQVKLAPYAGDVLWADRSWAKQGLWAIETCNPNGWGATKEKSSHAQARILFASKNTSKLAKAVLTPWARKLEL